VRVQTSAAIFLTECIMMQWHLTVLDLAMILASSNQLHATVLWLQDSQQRNPLLGEACMQ
jgi:hypothetical protein